MKLTPTLLAVAAVGLALTVQALRLDRARSTVAHDAYLADTIAASHDTSRTVGLSVSVLADSVHAIERRAIQALQRADALDHALGVERAARDSLSVVILGLRATTLSDTVHDTIVVSAAARPDTDRTATFELRDPPYTTHAEVRLPAPPSRATLTLAVQLDTLDLSLRLECGAPGADGVRPATAVLTGPRWATLRLGRVEQSPELCEVYTTTTTTTMQQQQQQCTNNNNN